MIRAIISFLSQQKMTVDKPSRHYNWQDHVIINLMKCLRGIAPHPTITAGSKATNPAASMAEITLSTAEQQLSAGLMRVNQCGEICAQALYLGQSFTARSPKLRSAFSLAAQEETEHLHWCNQRLNELNSHGSYLNPLWFTGSLLLGTFAGIIGDRWSLGFLAETEQQVSEHLTTHLTKLPVNDLKSRAIVAKMQQDEIAHASTAIHLGAAELPVPIKWLMQSMAKVMTRIAYYV